MSAALLQDNKKPNELEDDRESCLHVLTWTALCCTKVTLSGTDWNTIVMPFDEAYEGGGVMKGGQLKERSLVNNQIPDFVKFDDRPHLDELIAELTGAFAIRYQKVPRAASCNITVPEWRAFQVRRGRGGALRVCRPLHHSSTSTTR